LALDVLNHIRESQGMSAMQKKHKSAVGPHPRRSACAARSRAAELERLRRMSIAARIDEALSMGRKFSWLHPAPQDD
jgi:hypothetical protein